MTLLYIEDFSGAGSSDSGGDLAAVGWSGSPLGITTAALAAGGTKSWLVTSTNQTNKSIANTSALNTIIAGMRFAASATATQFYFDFGQSNTASTTLGSTVGCAVSDFDGTGTLHLVDGANHEVAASAPGAIPYGTEFYFEMSCALRLAGSDPVQDVTVRIDGITVVSGTGMVCPPAAAGDANWRTIVLEWPTNNGDFPLTDMYVLDGIAEGTGANQWDSLLGPSSVCGYLPTADGAVQLSPIGHAANWQNVSQVPLDAFTYYNTNAGGNSQEDYFPLGANPHGFFPVDVQAVCCRATATLAVDSPGTLSALAKSAGGTVATVGTRVVTFADFPVGTADGITLSPPGSSGAWTVADFTGCSYGYSWAGTATNVVQVAQRLVLALGIFSLSPPAPPIGPRSTIIV